VTGNLLQSPHMDRIAKERSLFSLVDTEPVGGPSRATLMTWQFAGQNACRRLHRESGRSCSAARPGADQRACEACRRKSWETIACGEIRLFIATPLPFQDTLI
jgi:hypothetical protein